MRRAGHQGLSWLVPAALYALALAARLAFLHVRPYGDEAHHYYIAREFGVPPANLLDATDTRWLFWWRPLFSVLLSPGAQASFTGFRLDYMLLVSLLAPALWWWLRGRGVRRVASAAAGIVIAVHPYFVLWGVRAFPDELMATALVGGLALWERRRFAWGCLLLLAAIWVKEVALIPVLVLCGLEGLRAVRDRTGSRPALAWRHAGLVAVLALAWLPHWYALSIGGRAPGWSRGGDLRLLLDQVFLTTWAIPLVVAALASWRGRRPAILALSMLAFYGYYTWRGGATEQWYYVLPATFAVAAIAAGIDAWAEKFAAWLPTAAVARLTTQAPPVAIVVLLLVAQVLLPGLSPLKAHLHPGVALREDSYGEMVKAEHARDQDLWTLLDRTSPEDWEGVLAIDVPWFYPLWPLSDRATALGSTYTDNAHPPSEWATVIEQLPSMTLVWRTGTPRNQAILDTYVDCIAIDTPQVVAIHGKQCPGRSERLAAAWG